MSKDTQSRKWQITINNPKEKGMTHEKIKDIMSGFKNLIYWCMADEIGGEKETYHTHVYFHFKSPMRFSTLKKQFPSAHFEMAKGTATQNKEYIFKTGKWLHDKKADTRVSDTQEEGGDMPIERQGQRNDLIDLLDMIKEGKTNFEIIEENPDYILQIEKLDKLRQTVTEEKYKNEFRKLEVTYIFGETGTGKTRGVMEKYGYPNVYRVTDYKNPWDGYKGQEVIVFEEFRGGFKISEMLNYLDGYPLELPARYSNRIACFNKVYMISNEPLQNLYRNVQRENPETWQALLRRINEVHNYEGNQIIKYTLEDYMKIDNYKVFRTNDEIDNILNLAYVRMEKEHAGNILFK